MMRIFHACLAFVPFLLTAATANPHAHARHSSPNYIREVEELVHNRRATNSSPSANLIDDATWKDWCNKMGIAQKCQANPSWRPVSSLPLYKLDHSLPYKITFKAHRTEPLILFIRSDGSGGPYWGTPTPKLGILMQPGTELHLSQPVQQMGAGTIGGIFQPYYFNTSRPATGAGAGDGYIEEGQGEFSVSSMGEWGTMAGLTPSFETAEHYGRRWTVTGSTGAPANYDVCSYHCNDAAVAHCLDGYHLKGAGTATHCLTENFNDWDPSAPIVVDFHAQAMSP